jgi:hypothetical protein
MPAGVRCKGGTGGSPVCHRVVKGCAQELLLAPFIDHGRAARAPLVVSLRLTTGYKLASLRDEDDHLDFCLSKFRLPDFRLAGSPHKAQPRADDCLTLASRLSAMAWCRTKLANDTSMNPALPPSA